MEVSFFRSISPFFYKFLELNSSKQIVKLLAGKHELDFLGGLQPKKTAKNRKKTSPKFEICGSVRFFFGFFRFFSVFFGFFRFFVVLFRFFSVFFGLNFDKKFQSFKNHVNNEVLGGQELPNNTPNAYKAQQMSYKSYYNQQEPLNKNQLNQSKLAKMEKPKKTEKNRKKTVPNLKFGVAFGFFWVATPPPPIFYKYVFINSMFVCRK